MDGHHAGPGKVSTTASFLSCAEWESKYDPDAPILFKVGHLGRNYESWIKKKAPRTKCRFFSSDFAEACSKTAWWVVPLLWLPFFSSVLIYCKISLGLSLAILMSWTMCGIVAWQALGESLTRPVVLSVPL